MASKKLSEMTPEEVAEYEQKLNDYARHEFIQKLLAQILVDMTIARDIRHTDPMEFPNMLKTEIDNIVNLWKQKEHAKAANGSTTDTTARNTTGTSTESPA